MFYMFCMLYMFCIFYIFGIYQFIWFMPLLNGIIMFCCIIWPIMGFCICYITAAFGSI